MMSPTEAMVLVLEAEEAENRWLASGTKAEFEANRMAYDKLCDAVHSELALRRMSSEQ